MACACGIDVPYVSYRVARYRADYLSRNSCMSHRSRLRCAEDASPQSKQDE